MTSSKKLNLMTISDLRKKYFSEIEPLDFDLILEAVLKKPRSFILSYPEFKIAHRTSHIAHRKIKRRIKGEPLAYILGHIDFYGLDFKVNKNVLVPRPETELMVDEAVKKTINHENKKTIFIDVGTGSGCIIISIAKLLNQESRIMNHEYFGFDISSKALIVAKRNAKIHGVEKRIIFKKGSLLVPILKSNKLIIQNSQFIILANLPYVGSELKELVKNKESVGLKFEPRQALYGGKDGLDLYRKLAEQVKELKEKTSQDITVLCEINHEQAREMKKIFSFAKKIEIKKDYSGRNRLVIAEI